MKARLARVWDSSSLQDLSLPLGNPQAHQQHRLPYMV